MNPAAPTPSQREPSQQGSQAALRVFEGEFLIDDDNSRREQPADNTCRPVFDAIEAPGHEFEPFQPIYRDSSLPASPMALFQLFIPELLVKEWVQYTNNAAGPLAPPVALQKRARKTAWTPFTVEEMYLWLGLVIYVGIHSEKAIERHWVIQKEGSQHPIHRITKFMTRDRFQQIQRHVRIYPHGIKGAFACCNGWSNHIQETSIQLYNPGTFIAVDEAMDRFTGRSLQTTTVPNKPTPHGFKVWVVAQRGYFLRWLWHDPKAPLGPVGSRRKRKRKTEDDNKIYLNPTQAVVVALVDLLPKQTYHVYLDNLFSSPNLFEALRQQDVAATGTCRVNCGIYKQFIEAKARDTKGDCWAWGTFKVMPTPNGKV